MSGGQVQGSSQSAIQESHQNKNGEKVKDYTQGLQRKKNCTTKKTFLGAESGGVRCSFLKSRLWKHQPRSASLFFSLSFFLSFRCFFLSLFSFLYFAAASPPAAAAVAAAAAARCLVPRLLLCKWGS